MQERERLLDMIQVLIEENDGELPLVTLDDFFQGNSDEGSLGTGMRTEEDLPIEEIYKKLKQIEKLPNVCTVLVDLHDDWEMSLDNSEIWPASESIYIYTMASIKVVRQWIIGLPCEAYDGWIDSMPLSAPSVPPGYFVYTLRWN
ncbi:hypothetical protein DKL61_03890 [Gammaproteobacteria bacterium ESL0073]|uniref:Uncharacterized protein n=1 Tax=Entomomonas moraniae TaxID=2213226 RepID=A0A3Q9JL95_9GAMM|nr:hypothetical protein [Entomomonas moraniae]AWM79558.1 hypothetical protein DKL61_03890 [Gammaproteobacteria bacterium ESL0073]AZS50817.1 hypothetical protein DM558_08495 [Entomomonas moraniae]